jgi:hypothetical protein
MLFSILDLELSDDFYSKKLKFNSSDKVPFARFKWALEKWIQSGTTKDNATKAISLDTYYKFDIVQNMAGLLDVIDKESYALFLMDDTTRNIVVACTIHSMKNVPIV